MKLSLNRSLASKVPWLDPDVARKLQKIEHLNVTPELFGPILANLVEAGTRHLNGDGDDADDATR